MDDDSAITPGAETPEEKVEGAISPSLGSPTFSEKDSRNCTASLGTLAD
jgi:hypothetical protein